MNSQNKQILNYLNDGNSITPIDALNLFGCFRLGARIHDLKGEGYDIKTEIKSVNGKRFAEYRLDRDTTQIDDNFKYH